MDKVIGTTIVLVILFLALAAMFLAWRKRIALQSHYRAQVPGVTVTDHSDTPQSFDVFYVATTLASDALERITIPGLSFRAKAQLLVSQAGVTIKPLGEKSNFIASSQIIQIHRGQVTIDKAVEKDGLTAISWNGYDTVAQGPIELTSFFRISSPELRATCEQALTQNFPHATQSPKEVAS